MSDPVPAHPLSNARAARELDEIASLMELRGDRGHRVRAFRRVARLIGKHGEPIAPLVAAGRASELEGVGAGLAGRLEELLASGRIGLREELLAEVPVGLLALLRLRGLGVGKVRKLWREAGVTTPAELLRACREQRLRELSGFSAAAEIALLAALEQAQGLRGRRPGPTLRPLAERLLAAIAAHPAIARAALVGRLARQAAQVGALELLASHADASAREDAARGLAQSLAGEPWVAETRLAGRGLALRCEDGPIARIVVCADATWAQLRLRRRAATAHWRALRDRAAERGVDLDAITASASDESAAYDALGLATPPLQLREPWIPLAAEPRRLVEPGDLRGALHCHTVASDGRDSLEAMAAAARDRGWSYLAITDHSRSSALAGGLEPEALGEQIEAIAAFNRQISDQPAWSGFRLLSGSEVDILADGTLDYDDDLLARLDIVVAAIHSGLDQPAEKQTQRLLAAIAHPLVDIVAHPHGRQIGRRPSPALDLPAIARAAAANRVALESNGSPRRLDLDGESCAIARAAGALIACNPDAHSTAALANTNHAVTQAQRGGLGVEDVLNTRRLDEVLRGR